MVNKEIKITPPEGFEIDKENSTFECIKFKPIVKRWRDNKGTAFSGYYIDHASNIIESDFCANRVWNHNVFATEKQAKSALAMAQISQIMANDERFGGTITDKEWKDVNFNKFCIGYNAYRDKLEVYYTDMFTNFLAFHTREQAALFLKENEDLVKDYYMLD